MNSDNLWLDYDSLFEKIIMSMWGRKLKVICTLKDLVNRNRGMVPYMGQIFIGFVLGYISTLILIIS